MCLVSKCIIIILQWGLFFPCDICGLSQGCTHRPASRLHCAIKWPLGGTNRQFTYFFSPPPPPLQRTLVFLFRGNKQFLPHRNKWSSISPSPEPSGVATTSQSYLSPHTFFFLQSNSCGKTVLAASDIISIWPA